MDFFKHSFMELAGWRDIENIFQTEYRRSAQPDCLIFTRRSFSIRSAERPVFSCYRQRGGSKTSMR